MATFNTLTPASAISAAILRAIYVEDLEKVNEIIDSFVPPYLLPWEEGQALISKAITTRRLDIAKILIKRGCQINTIRDYLSFYSNAMLYGDVELVSLLLDKDPRSLDKSQYISTLFHLAISESQEAIVKLFLDLGVKINLPNSNGLFPVNIAAKRGNYDILKLLLDAGASTESKSFYPGRTSLFYAVESGNVKVVTLLLKYGANCNVTSSEGKTLLHWAIERCQAEIIKVLVDAGADLNQRNIIGQTPLHVACMLNNKFLIWLLLNAGADINAVDNNGMVPCSAFEKKILSSCVFMNNSVSFLLLKQLIILKEGGLYLHSKNKAIYDMFVQTYCSKEVQFKNILVFSQSEVVKDIVNRCQEEISLMKEIKSNSSTCYSILKKLNSPLNIATEAELTLLQSVLVDNKCPLYQVILEAQFKYATLRNNLLTEAEKCFSIVIQHSENKLPLVPEEMIRYITSFLNNCELELLIRNIKQLKGNS